MPAVRQTRRAVRRHQVIKHGDGTVRCFLHLASVHGRCGGRPPCLDDYGKIEVKHTPSTKSTMVRERIVGKLSEPPYSIISARKGCTTIIIRVSCAQRKDALKEWLQTHTHNHIKKTTNENPHLHETTRQIFVFNINVNLFCCFTSCCFEPQSGLAHHRTAAVAAVRAGMALYLRSAMLSLSRGWK